MTIIDPRDQGAAGDGSAKDTVAIQSAIDACSQAGGGTVALSHGTFLTGTLYLRDQVTLHVDVSAVLLASPDIDDYAQDTHHQRYRNEAALDRCLIYAEDVHDIALVGSGEINGNAASFPNAGSDARPMLIRLLRASRIRMRDLRLRDAASWTTAFLDSDHINIDGVHVYNDSRHNGDGLDFDNCSDVWVSNCSLVGTDDNLCLQSSGTGRPMRNVHITNCTFTSLCAGIRIGLKSMGTIQDVVISNCTMTRVWREGIKIECTEGGVIENIVINTIAMRNVSRPIYILLNNRFEPDGLGSSIELDEMPAIGRMRDVTISDISAVDDEEMEHTHYRFGDDIMGSPRFNGIRVDAERKHPIERLALARIRYTSIGGVRHSEIPSQYPNVVDRLLDPASSEEDVSSNYYPDWSRTAFLDVRNVNALTLDDLVFQSLRPDERTPYLVENCRSLFERIRVLDTESAR